VETSRFADHLEHPRSRGPAPVGAASGAAGGAACGDLVRISLRVEGERIAAASFEASGCGAALAAGSAAVALVDGSRVLDAGRVGPDEVAAELGGLSSAKRHAAELAADALARALGAAAAAGASAAGRPGATLVALSGGVDSAVAALRLREQGRDVAAVTVELWSDPDNDGAKSCCSPQAVRGARSLAHRLGIPHFTLDLRAPFRAGVVEPFLQGHRDGETPNPCVGCNGHVRLDAMLDLAGRLGAATLATGHYARLSDDGDGPLLRAAADPAKDQTYMLSAVGRATLARLEFPLGELTKPEVRALAEAAGLAVARKPDSQDLCFLAGTGRAEFLRRHANLAEQPGDVVDAAGAVVGRHRGHHAYTVGQRRGLEISAPAPVYVLAKDAAANRVTVGPREALRTHRVAVRGATLHRDGARVDRVRLRYHAKALPARIAAAPAEGRHRRLELELAEPADGAAPGQTACLLDGDLVVGWATIAP
jgi:tRNA-specific 2-thiouridylase